MRAGLSGDLAALIDQGLTFGEVVNVYAARRSPEELADVARAQERWTREGEIEVDENALTSRGDESGTYVMAWVWVYDTDNEEDDT